LTFLRDQLCGYALANGTIGVYNNETRVWHAKSKHTVQAINAFDLDSDGVPELIAGWSNGRMEVRNDQVGELVYKDRFDSAIAQIVIADYRMDGRDEIIACSADGEIRGYLPAEEEMQGNLMAVSSGDNALQTLYTRKQELLAELKSYEQNQKQLKKGEVGAGAVPVDTQLITALVPAEEGRMLELQLSTNNDTVIKMAIVFSEALFDEESLVVHPSRPSQTLSIPIKPGKNAEAELFVKAVVGHGGSNQDHVFETTQAMPKFGAYMFADPRDLNPPNSVSFRMSERVNRIILWIKQSFTLLTSEVELMQAQDESLDVGFRDVRNGDPIVMRILRENGGNMFTLGTVSMELAGDIIQDLC
jgi:Bardet-Biedl syndrome 2 protein